MGTRVIYPADVKMKAVKMRLTGVPVKEVMKELNIRNKTHTGSWLLKGILIPVSKMGVSPFFV